MINNANVETIRKWKFENGWYISPDGNRVKLGDWVKLGDGVTSEQLNKDFIANLPDEFIAWKWVNQDRTSPNFDGGTKIEYKKDEIVDCPAAIISDQQCDIGLHVLRAGYRPEYAGLCQSNHQYIKLDVLVKREDVCFGGLPTMDAKLRVRKLKVLE